MNKMRLTTNVRLGLRHFTTGMHTVLVLGILNRVMRVEMELDMTLVSVVLSVFYFAALASVLLGYRSDTRPYFGYHRTPYILAGVAVTALTTSLAPFVALFMEAQRGLLLPALTGLGLFLIMGVGMYMGTTAYISLIADLTTEEEHGKVTGIIWAMLMLGLLGGVFLGTFLMPAYTPQSLVRLFLVSAGILIVLNIVAIWGMEKPYAVPRPSEQVVSLRQAVAVLVGSRQARLFFAFVFSAMFFLFLQQIVLEPFGGEVFGMSVRETTMFNAYQVTGTLAAMAVAGGWLIKRIGAVRTSTLGALVGAAAFSLMALSGLLEQPGWLRPAILLMGIGMGGLTVGGVTMMLGMTVPGRAGLYMGTWTLADSLARGLSGMGGGGLFDLAQVSGASDPLAYATVFVIETLGMFLTVALVLKVDSVRFRAEAKLITVSSHDKQPSAAS